MSPEEAGNTELTEICKRSLAQEEESTANKLRKRSKDTTVSQEIPSLFEILSNFFEEAIDTITSLNLADLSDLEIRLLNNDKIKSNRLLLKTDVTDSQEYASLRVETKNQHGVKVFFEISYHNGKIAILPFYYKRKKLENHRAKEIAFYLNDMRLGQKLTLDKYFRILRSKVLNPNNFHNAELIERNREAIINQLIQVLVEQLSLINQLNKKYLGEKIRGAESCIKHDGLAANIAQTIEVDGKATDTLLMFRCNELSCNDIFSYGHSHIPHAFRIQGVKNQEALRFCSENSYFFSQ